MFLVVRSECTTGTMADMQDCGRAVIFVYGIDDPVNVGPAAIEKLTQPGVFRDNHAPRGIFFETTDRRLKTIEPGARLPEMLSRDPDINLS